MEVIQLNLHPESHIEREILSQVTSNVPPEGNIIGWYGDRKVVLEVSSNGRK